jgi:hypothetical protein
MTLNVEAWRARHVIAWKGLTLHAIKKAQRSAEKACKAAERAGRPFSPDFQMYQMHELKHVNPVAYAIALADAGAVPYTYLGKSYFENADYAAEVRLDEIEAQAEAQS